MSDLHGCLSVGSNGMQLVPILKSVPVETLNSVQASSRTSFGQ